MKKVIIKLKEHDTAELLRKSRRVFETNRSPQVIKPKKGKGAYTRKAKHKKARFRDTTY